MVTENIAKQIIDFQKSTFDNSFNAVVMLQDHAERMTKTVMDQAAWLPEEGKKAMDEWVRMYKNGREELKELVDQNFKKMADFFEDPATIFTQPKVQEPKPAKAAK
jgi:polyhydroxyalkanoate synthesis regulator phasin